MAVGTGDQRIQWAIQQRDASLARVQPPLKGVPSQDELPKSSQDLPRAVLTPREIELTEGYDVMELLALLKSRKVSVEEVTRAFLRRAALAQAATNCLTELLWDFAIKRAQYLDSLPEPQGEFFGLPVSAKEHQGMVGENIVTSAGSVAWIGKEHNSNLLYDTLWAEGCVFYCRTTQPQAIMHLETESVIYGRTVNPYNRDLTPGGSSGGESALIGMRGSIFGIGSDIGGSIRCPAAHCGLYGFKPSTKRISTLGIRAGMAGRPTIFGAAGPMTVSRDAMELLMKVALAAKPWRIDPTIVLKPWEPYVFARPLKVAIQWWDGVVQPHPPMTRALREVAAACKLAGMEVVDWNCEHLDHARAWEILTGMYWPDGGEQVLTMFKESGEKVLPLTEFIIHEQPNARKRTAQEIMDLCCERDAYQAMYAKAWADTGKNGQQEVDVILCPPNFGAATPHDQSRYWGYTSQWNMLDYPGAVFPVTTVDPAKDVKDLDYVPKNAQDKFVYDMYEPAKFAGAPVGLQVIARRYEDEKCLAAVKEIERAMGRK